MKTSAVAATGSAAHLTRPVKEHRRSNILILADNAAARDHMVDDLNRLEGGTFRATGCRIGEALNAISSARPDAALLDIESGSVDPLVLIKNIRAKQPDLPLLLLLTRADPLFSARVLRAGAQGCLIKSEMPALLGPAIETVLHGGRYVSEMVMQRILHNLAETDMEPDKSRMNQLSDRELVIFQLLGLGHTARQIAHKLNLSVKTVNTHRANIKRKMQFADIQQLTRCAKSWLRNGGTAALRTGGGKNTRR